MGFFSTLKNKLGIGGVKVKLQIPHQVSKEGKAVEGKLMVTTKSEQKVNDIVVEVYEKWTVGKHEPQVKKFSLGQITLSGQFTIIPGETKEIDFLIPFEMVKSKNDHLKDQGGLVGALGKVGSMLDNERSEYYVSVEVDVESAALDPTDTKRLNLV